MNKVRTN